MNIINSFIYYQAAGAKLCDEKARLSYQPIIKHGKVFVGIAFSIKEYEHVYVENPRETVEDKLAFIVSQIYINSRGESKYLHTFQELALRVGASSGYADESRYKDLPKKQADMMPFLVGMFVMVKRDLKIETSALLSIIGHAVRALRYNYNDHFCKN